MFRDDYEPLENIPKLPPFPPLNPVQARAGQRNIDTPFDDFSPPGIGIGGSAGGTNRFTVTDATLAGVEKIAVSPGYLEVFAGTGFSTLIMPTMGGSPLTDGPTINAVTGPVFLAVTIDGSGTPTAAYVQNANILPEDTATLRHTQIGEIDVGVDVVTIVEQTVTENIPYFVSSTGFSASLLTRDSDTRIAVRAGMVLLPLTMDANTSVPADISDVGDTHAWLKVEWDEDYAITAAALEFGTAWPAPPYSIADKYINIPVANITSGQLVQVRTGNVMLHVTAVTGGIILMPASP